MSAVNDDSATVNKKKLIKKTASVTPAGTAVVKKPTVGAMVREVAGSAVAASYSATAYCLGGRTASGSGVRRGIIAADPRVLPLGTRVLVTAGNWSGIYTVADTGGAIKGRKIDVWVPNMSEARRFGRRTVQITVLGR